MSGITRQTDFFPVEMNLQPEEQGFRVRSGAWAFFRQSDLFDGAVESNCAVLEVEHRLELSPSVTGCHGDISQYSCHACQANVRGLADQMLACLVIRWTQLSVCDDPAFAAYVAPVASGFHAQSAPSNARKQSFSVPCLYRQFTTTEGYCRQEAISLHCSLDRRRTDCRIKTQMGQFDCSEWRNDYEMIIIPRA